MKNDRLVSRLELARRLTGVKKTKVYDDCKQGAPLHAAMVGQHINLEHKNAKMYCAEFGYQEPDIVAERAKATKAATAKAKSAPKYDLTPPPEHLPVFDYDDDEGEDDDIGATGYMDMSLRDIVKRYGKRAQFRDYVSAYKVLVSTQAAEEKMARDRKEFAHFSHIERLAMHIDGLHKMLLTDAAKNIADTAKTLTAAGASDVVVRAAVTKVLEQVIKMAKANSDRIIRSAKS